MPYKIKGKEVWHFKNNKWSLKQTAKSHDNAVKTVHLLQGMEHGWQPDNIGKNCIEENKMKHYHTKGEGKKHEARESVADEVLEHAIGYEAPDEKSITEKILDRILYKGKYKK